MLTELFPNETLSFDEGKMPWDLKNNNPDIYLFDIGGLCHTDFSGGQRMRLCSVILRELDDHPNTKFVPWSSFTRKFIRYAFEEEKLEKIPINMWLPSEQECQNKMEYELEEDFKKWVKQ